MSRIAPESAHAPTYAREGVRAYVHKGARRVIESSHASHPRKASAQLSHAKASQPLAIWPQVNHASLGSGLILAWPHADDAFPRPLSSPAFGSARCVHAVCSTPFRAT
eukprot:4551814-Pleurochrysis_carterae.AAC.1